MNGKQAKKLRKQVYGDKAIVVRATMTIPRMCDPDRRKYQALKKEYYRTKDKKPLEKNVQRKKKYKLFR